MGAKTKGKNIHRHIQECTVGRTRTHGLTDFRSHGTCILLASSSSYLFLSTCPEYLSGYFLAALLSSEHNKSISTKKTQIQDGGFAATWPADVPAGSKRIKRKNEKIIEKCRKNCRKKSKKRTKT